MNFRLPRKSVFFRTFIMLMLLSVIIITVFSLLMIPRSKMSILKGMESQARSLSASLASVSANAFVLGDYSFIVDHNMQVLTGSEDIKYIIIVKHSGLSLVHTRGKWDQREKPDPLWSQNGSSIPGGRIVFNNIAKGDVYHYTYPLQFSRIVKIFLLIKLNIFYNC